MKKLLFLSLGFLPSVYAHEGHGVAGLHWHGSDSVGFIVLAAVVAGAIWAARRK